MPRNLLNYVVFDFETYGLDPKTSEAIQIGMKAYNGQTLEPIPVSQGGEFESMMKPLYPDRLDSPQAQKALECNKKTKAQILAAPDQKVVWQRAIKWVSQWNNKQASFGGKPIACGKNIRNFDNQFLLALNTLHGPQKEKTYLFNNRLELDLEDFLHHWFSFDDTLPNLKMDTVREYFGMSTEGAHDALVDVRQTGDLIMKFLRLYRHFAQKTTKSGEPFIPFKNSFAPKTQGAV